MVWLDAQAPASQHLPAIIVKDLMFAVHCLDRSARRTRLLGTLTTILANDFRNRILPYDSAVIYGQQVGVARRAGTTIGQADGQIAAIAIAHNAAQIVTRDAKPFVALHLKGILLWNYPG